MQGKDVVGRVVNAGIGTTAELVWQLAPLGELLAEGPQLPGGIRDVGGTPCTIAGGLPLVFL